MNILSLTGGGYKGVFSISVLRELETYMHSKDIDSCVDVYAGTSAGSIIAAALAFGKDTEFIHEQFLKFGQDIFPRNFVYKKWPASRKLSWVHGPGPGYWWNRYSNKGLRKLLVGIFGEDATLRMSLKPLIITAVDIETSTPIVMSSFPSKFRYSGLHFENMKVVDAILSSCAAPAYFPVVRPNYPKENKQEPDDILTPASNKSVNPDEGHWLGDGGLAANAPDLLAAAEAITTYGTPFDELKMLSVGTTKVTRAVRKKFLWREIRKKTWGVFPWLVFRPGYLIDVMMHAQVRLAERLLGQLFERDNYIRLDQKLSMSDKIDLDDAYKSSELSEIAEKVVAEFMDNEAHDPHRLQLFLDGISTTETAY